MNCRPASPKGIFGPGGRPIIRVQSYGKSPDGRAGGRGRRLPWLLCALATVLVVGVYGNALRSPFVYDDHLTILTNSSMLDLWDVRAIIHGSTFRPLENLSFALDHAVWGLQPFGFHLTNLILHAINVGLFFAVTFVAVRDAGLGQDEGTRGRETAALTAFVAAALFAVHPALTEAVGYISGRGELLYALFFLLALLTMRWGKLRGRRRWVTLSLAYVVLALASKEVAIMFPFVWLAYDRLLLQRDPDTGGRLRRLHPPLIMVMVLAGATRAAVFLWVENPSSGNAVHQMAIYFLIQCEVIWRYVALLLAPVSLSIFHDVGLSPTRSLLGATALLLVGILLFRGGRRTPLPVLGVLWFLLMLVPSSSIIPLPYPMAEHRMYLATGGLFIAFASGTAGLLAAAHRRPLWLHAARYAPVVVVLVVLSVLTLARNTIWADSVTLWRDAAQKAPHGLTYTALGDALRAQGGCAPAIPAYRDAIAHAPGFLMPRDKLRACLTDQGRIVEARLVEQTLVAIDPDFSRLCGEIATMTAGRVRMDVCTAAHRGRLNLDPDYLTRLQES